MKKLMKSATLLASVGAMLYFAGCNSVGDKPEDVVLAVLKNAQAGKADQAFLNKYCEDDTAKLFATFGSEWARNLQGAMFTVVYAFVDNDVAVVKIKQEGGKDAGESYYDLKKIDGVWKMRINKEAHDDYYCGPSQKTISECVEAYKSVFRGDGVKYVERWDNQALEQLQKKIAGVPETHKKEFEEFRDSINSAKVRKHNTLHDGTVEIELEAKDGRTADEIKLKVIDNMWKICGE